jgi:hypothetical protein
MDNNKYKEMRVYKQWFVIDNWYIYIIVWMDFYAEKKAKELHGEECKYGCTYWGMILCFNRIVWCVFIACGVQLIKICINEQAGKW